MPEAIDMTGKRYGRLVVIERREKDIHGDILWLCKCDCGNTKEISGKYLRTGKIKSCGCFRKERAQEGIARGDPCKLTRGILCNDQTHCDKCGWNPEVVERRKQESRERKKKGSL